MHKYTSHCIYNYVYPSTELSAVTNALNERFTYFINYRYRVFSFFVRTTLVQGVLHVYYDYHFSGMNGNIDLNYTCYMSLDISLG